MTLARRLPPTNSTARARRFRQRKRDGKVQLRSAAGTSASSGAKDSQMQIWGTVVGKPKPKPPLTLTPNQQKIVAHFGAAIPDDGRRARYVALVETTLSTMPGFTDTDVAFVALVAADGAIDALLNEAEKGYESAR